MVVTGIVDLALCAASCASVGAACLSPRKKKIIPNSHARGSMIGARKEGKNPENLKPSLVSPIVPS